MIIEDTTDPGRELYETLVNEFVDQFQDLVMTHRAHIPRIFAAIVTALANVGTLCEPRPDPEIFTDIVKMIYDEADTYASHDADRNEA